MVSRAAVGSVNPRERDRNANHVTVEPVQGVISLAVVANVVQKRGLPRPFKVDARICVIHDCWEQNIDWLERGWGSTRTSVHVHVHGQLRGAPMNQISRER